MWEFPKNSAPSCVQGEYSRAGSYVGHGIPKPCKSGGNIEQQHPPSLWPDLNSEHLRRRVAFQYHRKIQPVAGDGRSSTIVVLPEKGKSGRLPETAAPVSQPYYQRRKKSSQLPAPLLKLYFTASFRIRFNSVFKTL